MSTQSINEQHCFNQRIGTHLPNIPDSEKVSGWRVDGSANIPPTPGPITCPSANAADGHKVPPRYSQTSEHGDGGGDWDWCLGHRRRCFDCRGHVIRVSFPSYWEPFVLSPVTYVVVGTYTCYASYMLSASVVTVSHCYIYSEVVILVTSRYRSLLSSNYLVLVSACRELEHRNVN